MNENEVQRIIAIDKFKNYKLYKNIEKNIQKIEEEIVNNQTIKIKNIVRRVYISGAIFYMRQYEKMLWEVIKDEQIRNIKNYG